MEINSKVFNRMPVYEIKEGRSRYQILLIVA